jgi:signal transduction histidine kinase
VRPETEFSAEIAVAQALLPDAVSECLFRAAQEGVSNAVRHGRPGRVWLRASMEDGMAVLTVQDDGAGGRDDGREGPGLGLAGMRARAASLGGQVEVQPAPGWRVTVRVPVAQAA